MHIYIYTYIYTCIYIYIYIYIPRLTPFGSVRPAPQIKLLDHEDAALHSDVSATLINAALQAQCRAALVTKGAIRAAARLLGGDETQREHGVALLQNLAISPKAHGPMVEHGVLQALPQLLQHRTNRPSIRRKVRARLGQPVGRSASTRRLGTALLVYMYYII